MMPTLGNFDTHVQRVGGVPEGCTAHTLADHTYLTKKDLGNPNHCRFFFKRELSLIKFTYKRFTPVV